MLYIKTIFQVPWCSHIRMIRNSESFTSPSMHIPVHHSRPSPYTSRRQRKIPMLVSLLCLFFFSSLLCVHGVWCKYGLAIAYASLSSHFRDFGLSWLPLLKLQNRAFNCSTRWCLQSILFVLLEASMRMIGTIWP